MIRLLFLLLIVYASYLLKVGVYCRHHRNNIDERILTVSSSFPAHADWNSDKLETGKLLPMDFKRTDNISA